MLSPIRDVNGNVYLLTVGGTYFRLPLDLPVGKIRNIAGGYYFICDNGSLYYSRGDLNIEDLRHDVYEDVEGNFIHVVDVAELGISHNYKTIWTVALLDIYGNIYVKTLDEQGRPALDNVYVRLVGMPKVKSIAGEYYNNIHSNIFTLDLDNTLGRIELSITPEKTFMPAYFPDQSGEIFDDIQSLPWLLNKRGEVFGMTYDYQPRKKELAVRIRQLLGTRLGLLLLDENGDILISSSESFYPGRFPHLSGIVEMGRDGKRAHFLGNDGRKYFIANNQAVRVDNVYPYDQADIIFKDEENVIRTILTKSSRT